MLVSVARVKLWVCEEGGVISRLRLVESEIIILPLWLLVKIPFIEICASLLF